MNSRRDDGQALVLTVLFLAAIIGAAALVLDVGSWFREKRALQATADAAALAGAQALPDPANALTLALQYAGANGGHVTASDVTVTSDLAADDTISVEAHTAAPGFLSRVLGVHTVNVRTLAVARADIPTEALHVAPMVVSKDHEWLAGEGCPCFDQPTSLEFGKMDDSGKWDASGAFGMLNLNGGNGTVGASTEAQWISQGFDQYLPLGQYKSDPGAKFNSANVQGALETRLDSTLLFPVFSTLSGNGQNAKYTIIGWVGFYLTSFDVHGNNATMNGYFTRYIASGIQSASGTNQPDFGVRSIQLVH